VRTLRALRAVPRRAGAALLEKAVRRAAFRAPTLLEPPEEPRSIFVLRNNDLGDLLVVTPLFEALRWQFPEAWITVGVGDWSRDVLLHNPWVSEVVPVNAPWFNKYADSGTVARWRYLRRSPEVRALARRRFDVGIDVLGSAWGSLLLLRAGIPWRLGVHGYAGGHSALQAAVDFDPSEQVGRSALRFAELLGATALPPVRPQIFLTREEADEGERWWALREKGQRRPRLVIGPAAGLPVKRWPLERFAALLRALAAEHPDLEILVLAGPGEESLVRPLVRLHPRAHAFARPPGLRANFALVAASDFVVCHSSLLLHVAAAFSRPTLALLGPSFPSAEQHQAQWGYPGICRSLALPTSAEVLDLLREELAGWTP
jgi:ADP-heptose:LPS heptosyltransferase